MVSQSKKRAALGAVIANGASLKEIKAIVEQRKTTAARKGAPLLQLADMVTGNSPLHEAVLAVVREDDCNLSVMRYLLHQDPKALDLVNHELDTPLVMACRLGAPLSAIKLLLESMQAVSESRNDDGLLVLLSSKHSNKSARLPEASLAGNEGPTNDAVTTTIADLLHAVCGGKCVRLELVQHFTIAEETIWKQPVGGFVDLDLNTPLHKLLANTSFLTSSPHEEGLQVVRTLVENYPQALTHQNFAKDAPLLVLCKNSSASSSSLTLLLVQYLIDRCPDAIRMTNIDGESPLHLLSKSSSSSLALIRYVRDGDPGASLLRNSFGETPLHLSCRHYKQKDVNGSVPELLLERGGKSALAIVNQDGETPLHLLCQHVQHIRSCSHSILRLIQELADACPAGWLVTDDCDRTFPLEHHFFQGASTKNTDKVEPAGSLLGRSQAGALVALQEVLGRIGNSYPADGAHDDLNNGGASRHEALVNALKWNDELRHFVRQPKIMNLVSGIAKMNVCGRRRAESCCDIIDENPTDLLQAINETCTDDSNDAVVDCLFLYLRENPVLCVTPFSWSKVAAPRR